MGKKPLTAREEEKIRQHGPSAVRVLEMQAQHPEWTLGECYLAVDRASPDLTSLGKVIEVIDLIPRLEVPA